MGNLVIELKPKDLIARVTEFVDKEIKESLTNNRTNIKEQLDDYFKRELFSNKMSKFEDAFDWAVEHAFREGLDKAMEELNFKELVAEKAKVILSDNSFIEKLAEAKIRSSLGLPM